MHLQDPKDFWTFINDKRSYPKGFYKIKFHLPYLNLERLQKKYNMLTKKIRESYNGKLDWEITAEKGGALNISETDEFQKAQINYFMNDLGGTSLDYFTLINKLDERFNLKIDFGSDYDLEAFGYTVNHFERLIKEMIQ
jgi:acyl carrier protein